MHPDTHETHGVSQKHIHAYMNACKHLHAHIQLSADAHAYPMHSIRLNHTCSTPQLCVYLRILNAAEFVLIYACMTCSFWSKCRLQPLQGHKKCPVHVCTHISHASWPLLSLSILCCSFLNLILEPASCSHGMFVFICLRIS